MLIDYRVEIIFVQSLACIMRLVPSLTPTRIHDYREIYPFFGSPDALLSHLSLMPNVADFGKNLLYYRCEKNKGFRFWVGGDRRRDASLGAAQSGVSIA